MITEDYVNFETAKLLKEKGFDEHCFCINYPLPEGGHHNIILPNLLNNSMIPFTDEYKFCRYKEDFITIPTLQMVMKWLREVHNLFIFPFPQMNTNKFWIEIYQLSDNQEWKNIYCESIDLQDYSTYETACEAAIKYCLENLI